MLLETTDIKKNDVLIYSENRFDLESNFKIVNKKSPTKNPQSISFYEIGKYINLPVPKNMIVYRLLTNHLSFNASITKYGFLISIEEAVELVYFDPVFAIKDIELIKKIIDFDTFRFKIQQIGLTSLSKKGKFLDYTEIFAFDLNADEARHQKDRVYAEAIFAFDVTFPGEEDEASTDVPSVSYDKDNVLPAQIVTSESFVRAKINTQERMKIENKIVSREETSDVEFKKSGSSESKSNDSEIGEDEGKDKREPEPDTSKEGIESNGDEREILENQKPISSISDFLQKQRLSKKESEKESRLTDSQNKFLNLFKSTTDLGNYLKERAKESFILKIEK